MTQLSLPVEPAAAAARKARKLPLPTILIVSAGVSILIVAVGLGAYALWPSPGAVGVFNGELTYAVTRGDLVISFTDRGNIRASRSVPIFCELEGQSTIVSVVPEGTYVNEGDLLVELDSSSLEQLVNQQRISVETAKAAMMQAEKSVEIQESQNASNIEQAELSVTLADLDKRKFEEGEFAQMTMKYENDVLIAQEELTRAQDKYEWTQKLAAKGYVTRMDEQADRLALNRARVQLEQSKMAQKVYADYTSKKERETYGSNLSQAKAALERARVKAEAEMAKVEADREAKRETYLLSDKRLKKLDDQLSKTKIFAPQDGMVVYEEPRYRGGRETVIEQGAEVRENQQLMELPNVSVMAVDMQVHESWIDQVREGLPALINIDALPNLNLRGRVTKVGLLPDQVNRWLNPNLKVYKTEISIDESQDTSLVRPGMTAKVQIVITKLENVVYVPVQSVTTIDKKQVCYVLTGSEFLPREVQGGLYNDSFIEIVSGLEEGETIQLNAPSPQGGSDWEKLEAFDEELDVVEGRQGAVPPEAMMETKMGREAGEGRLPAFSGAPGGGGFPGSEGGAGQGRAAKGMDPRGRRPRGEGGGMRLPGGGAGLERPGAAFGAPPGGSRAGPRPPPGSASPAAAAAAAAAAGGGTASEVPAAGGGGEVPLGSAPASLEPMPQGGATRAEPAADLSRPAGDRRRGEGAARKGPSERPVSAGD
ncbi:MAG: HlyD family efflux transporter periplasmic adaptor subunit [Planctomycetes bacterium]|nr:HlyD family efflux transporter periplasmic adaptor subunit [Planctomycetota bacterium]